MPKNLQMVGRRHRHVLRDNIQGITKPAIRRLCRRGGVKRISGELYGESRTVLKAFLEDVIRDAVTYTEYAKRKTVSVGDILYALKRQGRTLYGYGGDRAAHKKSVMPSKRTSTKRSSKKARRSSAKGKALSAPTSEPMNNATSKRAFKAVLLNAITGVTNDDTLYVFNEALCMKDSKGKGWTSLGFEMLPDGAYKKKADKDTPVMVARLSKLKQACQGAWDKPFHVLDMTPKEMQRLAGDRPYVFLNALHKACYREGMKCLKADFGDMNNAANRAAIDTNIIDAGAQSTMFHRSPNAKTGGWDEYSEEDWHGWRSKCIIMSRVPKNELMKMSPVNAASMIEGFAIASQFASDKKYDKDLLTKKAVWAKSDFDPIPTRDNMVALYSACRHLL